MSDQANRITKARLGVIYEAPFFGSLLMRLGMVRDDSQPTFCTDGRVIRYNETFAAGLDDSELRGVLVHEVAHCAQGHLWRRDQRESKRWNRACDFQINAMLTDTINEARAVHEATVGANRPFFEPWRLGKDWLLDRQYEGLSAEEIYARLPQEEGQGNANAASDRPFDSAQGDSVVGPGQFSDPGGGDGEGDGEAAATEGEWKLAVTQAATIAKMRGQLPGSLRRFVEELLAPRVAWREVLREFIRSIAREDYSWRRPNRRFASGGILLPSLHSEKMGRLAIGVDTSGSIDEHTLAEFQAEVQGALDETQPECIEVIYCDASVSGTEEFRPGDAVKLSPQGGGGTDFRPVFRYLDDAEEWPVACVYLTDGHGSFPNVEPVYPVLWASTERKEFPFGSVVVLR